MRGWGAVRLHVDSGWIGYALRAFSLVLFVWYVWSVHYAPHRNEPFGDADFDAAVRAINAGQPYHLLYPASENGPELLKRMNEGVVDQGVAILMGLGADALEWLNGSRTTMTSSSGRSVVMLLFAVTAGVIVAPGVPLPVAMAGIVAFYTLQKWGPVVVGPPVHWGVAFAAIVAAVYLGTVLKPWTWGRFVTLSLLAALAALTQILRQESAGVAYGVGLALLMSAGLAMLVGRHLGADVRPQAGLRPLARRALAGGLLLMAANAVVMPIERWCLSRQMRTPYAETPTIEHGSGWPLYLSLGYVSNPFNIAWRDPIGQLHADLISSGLVSHNAAVHAILMREYLSIVVSRPWLLIENVTAKAARVHALATRRVEKLPDVAVWQLPAHARLYQALPWLAVLLVVLVWWRGTPESAAIVVVSAALGAAASAGAVLVFPDYIGGVQGATMALAFIVPAAVASSLVEPAVPGPTSTPLARRILTWTAALAVAAILIGGAFVAIQWARYRAVQEQTLARDPLEAIEAQQFRYAHFFNDLPVTRQGRLVARLTASTDPRIARAVDLRRGDHELFRPEVLIRTATQLHLIAWMGNLFRTPVPPIFQGTTHSLFFICPECAPDMGENDFPLGAGFVNDLEWRGRYRMFSVPLNTKLETARFFHVGAERIEALDSRIEPTGLRTALMSSARIAY